MYDHRLFEEIRNVSLAMFRKNFFGVYHGSISARIDEHAFVINTKEAIFDEIDARSLIRLESGHDDYRWNTASLDARIHEAIYRRIPHAKYIAYTMPPYVTAYAFAQPTIDPMDYFGDRMIGPIRVYDPGAFGDWYDRAPHEISEQFARESGHVMVIRGYGVFAYDRDLHDLAKKIGILENSARLLTLAQP
jgi:L-fuculose-phosphate aldolase